MAAWRGFGYEGRPGTCLWCGRKLVRHWVADHAPGAVGRDAYSLPRKMPEKAGSYQDGHFCGLRCAYQFAVRAADLGTILERPRRVDA